MKIFQKIIGIVVFASLVFGLYRVGSFGYQNLRGARSAFGPLVKPPTNTASTNTASDTTGLGLTLPAGFHVSIFAKDVPNARVLVFDPTGTLLVSEPSQGKVVALIDSDNDGVSDKKAVVVEGLNLLHGLAFKDGNLYVGETDKVTKFSYNAATHTASNKQKLFDLAGNGNHFSRSIGFGPDGKLYVTIGSTCNVCLEKNAMRAAIYSAEPDGSNFRSFATGLRNSPFFIWHPTTKDMWATEMVRDLLGDDIPPDEINIVKSGSFYGWPYCYGKKIHDGKFDTSQKFIDLCNSSVPSHIDLQAHSAPLGLAFIPPSWPKEYQDDLLVSYHGSWNRTTPTGYKVVRMKLDKNGAYEKTEDFLTGFIEQNGAKGRPVDLLFDSKGVLYISDDKAGSVYRMSKI